MAKIEFQTIFKNISELKAGVVGDVMLDTYWWGNVERISPEAPVPVVALKRKENRLGGAANVALNAQALGSAVSIISIVGDDDDAASLEKLFKEKNISTKYLLKSKKRITTNKSRIISRNQQMLRLDAEMTADLEPADEERLIDAASEFIKREQPQVMILEDYNKGILTQRVISSIIEICNNKNIITAVDPKRRNFFSFKKASIFKPNLKEVREAFNILDDNLDKNALSGIHQKLKSELEHQVSLITLSEKGIFYQDANEASIIPAHIRNIADVSGAGDTVIAVASLVYASTGSALLMAEISNLAGGIVCEEVGTVAIDKIKLAQECMALL